MRAMKKAVFTLAIIVFCLIIQNTKAQSPNAQTPKVFIPNVCTPENFHSPNFWVEVMEPCEAFEMTVYNKWGELLYQTDQVKHKWDFKWNGVTLPADVYMCSVKIKKDGKWYYYTNTVKLIS